MCVCMYVCMYVHRQSYELAESTIDPLQSGIDYVAVAVPGCGVCVRDTVRVSMCAWMWCVRVCAYVC